MLYTISVILVCLITAVTCPSAGAPDHVCSHMVPGHGVESQPKPAPFMITFYAPYKCYMPGENITVSIVKSPKSKGKPFFIGFLMKARKAAENVSKPGVGKFIVQGNKVKLSCKKAGVTHTNEGVKDKKESLTVVWMAPKTPGTGDVVFQATIVQERVIFWTEILSKPLKECVCINTMSENKPVKLRIKGQGQRQITDCQDLKDKDLEGLCSADALGSQKVGEQMYCCDFCQKRKACVDSLTWKLSSMPKCENCTCEAIKKVDNLMKLCCERNLRGKGYDGKSHQCREMCCKSCKEWSNGP